MPLVNGGPVGPDGLGGAFKNTDASDRTALWRSLGARQGILSGGALSTPAGVLAMDVAAFRAAVAERDSAGTALARGYHAWADATTTVVFDAPSASSRVDAVILAVADISAGAGAFGSGVTEAGPQLLVVTGVSGTTVPRTDVEVQDWVGSGGWMRLADVRIDPTDTEVNDANVTTAADPYLSSTWRTLQLASGFTPGNNPGCRLHRGTVFFRGNVNGTFATGSVITIVPAGQVPVSMRPSQRVNVQVGGSSQASAVRCYIEPSGEIVAVTGTSAPAYVSLDGLSSNYLVGD